MSTTAPAAEFWDAALCAQVQHADVFHPRQGGHDGIAAKRVCRRCPVRQRCLQWALSLSDSDDQYGIYGGLSSTERRAARKQRRETP